MFPVPQYDDTHTRVNPDIFSRVIVTLKGWTVSVLTSAEYRQRQAHSFLCWRLRKKKKIQCFSRTRHQACWKSQQMPRQLLFPGVYCISVLCKNSKVNYHFFLNNCDNAIRLIASRHISMTRYKPLSPLHWFPKSTSLTLCLRQSSQFGLDTCNKSISLMRSAH